LNPHIGEVSKGCAYHGSNNDHCAVGLVLPPEIEDPIGTFCNVVTTYSNYFSEEIWNISEYELDLFQCCLHDSLTKHDGTKNINEWATPTIQRLEIYKLVAKAYNLTIPPHTTAYGKVVAK